MGAQYNAAMRHMAYEIYSADLLQVIGETMGVKVSKKFADIVMPDMVQQDTRSGDEIAADVIQRLGLVVNDTI